MKIVRKHFPSKCSSLLHTSSNWQMFWLQNKSINYNYNKIQNILFTWNLFEFPISYNTSWWVTLSIVFDIYINKLFQPLFKALWAHASKYMSCDCRVIIYNTWCVFFKNIEYIVNELILIDYFLEENWFHYKVQFQWYCKTFCSILKVIYLLKL